MGDVVPIGFRPATDGGPPIVRLPPRPVDAAGDTIREGPEHDRWQTAWERLHPAWTVRRRWEDAQAAKLRAATRAAAPHPNWHGRRPLCWVAIVAPTPRDHTPPAFARSPDARKRAPGAPHPPHHGAWEGDPRRCSEAVAAYDTTDRRAVGHLYGACAAHLLTALAADPTRTWTWATGHPLDRASAEAELSLLVLAAPPRRLRP